MWFPGGNGGTVLFFDKPTGHFYCAKGNDFADLHCADKQFFEAFHLPICRHSDIAEIFPVTCVGRFTGSSHSHLPALREHVELMTFQWKAQLYIFQNSTEKNVMDAIKAVNAEWPFKLNFSPPRLAKLMECTLKNYQRYGNARHNTPDYEVGQNFLKTFSQNVLDLFMNHLHTSQPYWTPPQQRKVGI